MCIRPASIRWLIFCVSLLLATPGFSESSPEDASSRLVVTLVEYPAEIAPTPNASSSEIVDQLLNGDTQPVRTIRLPTLSNCVALFRAGERIGIPQRASNGDAGGHEPVFVQVGTILQVTAKRTSSSVLMEFDYTTSRLSNEDFAGSSPRVKESTVQGTFSFKIGEPVLVGGLTASDGFYLVATVTEATPLSQTKD